MRGRRERRPTSPPLPSPSSSVARGQSEHELTTFPSTPPPPILPPPVPQIGTGAYGVVVAAEDTGSGSGPGPGPGPGPGQSLAVAVKKIPHFYADEIDGKRVLREAKMLRFMHHENVVRLHDLVAGTGATATAGGVPAAGSVAGSTAGAAASASDVRDVYIVTPLFDSDLHRVIYSKQTLSEEHCQYFLYQLIRGLLFTHSAGVLHRDIKPSNLLVNANCDLAIADFGLARGVHPGAGEGGARRGSLAPPTSTTAPPAPAQLTEYVVTRWYRAPELMLGVRTYGAGVDVWAAGCVFGELILRSPLFAGSDYQDTLRLIVETIGAPDPADLRTFVKSERALSFMARFNGRQRTPWASVFHRALRSSSSSSSSSSKGGAKGAPFPSPAALDLLDRMLVWNPSRRATVEECLAHPFLASLHAPEDEPTAPSRFDFSFEEGAGAGAGAGGHLDAAALKAHMWEEILAVKAWRARRGRRETLAGAGVGGGGGGDGAAGQGSSSASSAGEMDLDPGASSSNPASGTGSSVSSTTAAPSSGAPSSSAWGRGGSAAASAAGMAAAAAAAAAASVPPVRPPTQPRPQAPAGTPQSLLSFPSLSSDGSASGGAGDSAAAAGVARTTGGGGGDADGVAGHFRRRSSGSGSVAAGGAVLWGGGPGERKGGGRTPPPSSGGVGGGGGGGGGHGGARVASATSIAYSTGWERRRPPATQQPQPDGVASERSSGSLRSGPATTSTSSSSSLSSSTAGAGGPPPPPPPFCAPQPTMPGRTGGSRGSGWGSGGWGTRGSGSGSGGGTGR